MFRMYNNTIFFDKHCHKMLFFQMAIFTTTKKCDLPIVYDKPDRRKQSTELQLKKT